MRYAVPVSESKQALREAARLLDVDTHNARLYLRRVQQITGPVPYHTIVVAIREAQTFDVETVATAVKQIR
jgi:hypothetical protein